MNPIFYINVKTLLSLQAVNQVGKMLGMLAVGLT